MVALNRIKSQLIFLQSLYISHLKSEQMTECSSAQQQVKRTDTEEDESCLPSGLSKAISNFSKMASLLHLCSLLKQVRTGNAAGCSNYICFAYLIPQVGETGSVDPRRGLCSFMEANKSHNKHVTMKG